MPKLFSSTFFWARSMLAVTMLCWITSPSFRPMRSISLAMRSLPNIRMRSSSSEM